MDKNQVNLNGLYKVYVRGDDIMANTTNKGKVDKNIKKPISKKAKIYLIGYNLIQTIGWSYLLYQLITFYTSPKNNPKSLYDTIKWTVIIFQNAAILEVIHAIIHIVSSNPIITAVQIASRVIVVCGVLMVTISSRSSIGLPLALLAWSVTEVIRYSNYALSLIGIVPHFLVWLRYSTFIILYPLGITGELLCMYAAQEEIKKTQLFTIQMPNAVNFIFNYQYFLLLVMFLYIPSFPQLYLHMFSQRRKVLSPSKATATTKKVK